MRIPPQMSADDSAASSAEYRGFYTDDRYIECFSSADAEQLYTDTDGVSWYLFDGELMPWLPCCDREEGDEPVLETSSVDSETKSEDEENNNFCSPDVERTVGNVVAPHLEGKNDVALGSANNGAGRQSPFAHAWRSSTKPGLMGTCSVVADCLDSKGKRTTCTVLIDTGADLNTAKPRIHQKVEIPQTKWCIRQC